MFFSPIDPAWLAVFTSAGRICLPKWGFTSFHPMRSNEQNSSTIWASRIFTSQMPSGAVDQAVRGDEE